MSEIDSVVLRGNSNALYIWPIWVLAFAFGILNTASKIDSELDQNLIIITGIIFIAVAVPALIVSLVRIRGVWSMVVILLILTIVLFFTLAYDKLPLASTFIRSINTLTNKALVDIAKQITPNIYFAIGFFLSTISLIAHLFEFRKSVIITPKEIIVQGIYKGRQNYDHHNVDIKERRRDWFRYFFGFYAGDLEIHISHGNQHERIEIKNLTDINRKMAIIHQLRSA